MVDISGLCWSNPFFSVVLRLALDLTRYAAHAAYLPSSSRSWSLGGILSVGFVLPWPGWRSRHVPSRSALAADVLLAVGLQMREHIKKEVD